MCSWTRRTENRYSKPLNAAGLDGVIQRRFPLRSGHARTNRIRILPCRPSAAILRMACISIYPEALLNGLRSGAHSPPFRRGRYTISVKKIRIIMESRNSIISIRYEMFKRLLQEAVMLLNG